MITQWFKDRAIDDSENYYKALKSYQLDPNQRFVDVKNRIGLLPSAIYAQMYFANSNIYKRFRRELELHYKESNPYNRDVDILLVSPPNSFISRKDTQKFVHQAMGLGTSGQFALVSHVQINSNNVLSGAKRLFNIVDERRRQGRKVLLVSHSFGSAFVRVMLDQMLGSEIVNIKGWLNLSGLIFGSPRFHCSDKKNWLNRSNIAQRSFSMEQTYFRNSFDTRGIKTVHILGLKNDSTLSSQQVKEREMIKAFGPNDGVIPFSQYQFLQQPVLPLLDQGHNIDLGAISSTFLRTLSSMVSILPQKPMKSDSQSLDFL